MLIRKFSFLILVFSAATALAYPHITADTEKELKHREHKICKKVRKFGRYFLDPAITPIYKTNCVEKNPPTLSKMLIELFHAREHLFVENTPKALAFQKIIDVLGHEVRKLNDFEDPILFLDVSKYVRELSGFAVDHKSRRVWGQGDHGQKIVTFSLDDFKPSSVIMDEVKNKNWESISVDPMGRLWLLDNGDNFGMRNHIQLLETAPTDNPTKIKLNRLIKMTYIDGPRDSEAAFFYKDKLYLIEKIFFKPARLAAVEIKKSEFPNEQKAVATPVGVLPPLGYITDAFLNEKGQLFVLSHFGVYEIEGWKEKTGAKAKPIFERFMGQAEAFAYIGPNDFLIAREDGKVFRWKNGDFVGPEQKPTH